MYDKIFAAKQNSSIFQPTFRAFDKMMEKYSKYFNKQKEQAKKEIYHYYDDMYCLDAMNSFVSYYDKLKDNKLDKKMDNIENLPFKEHEFGMALDAMLKDINSVYDGLEIKKEMSIDEKIGILRNFHKFKREISPTIEPKIESLLDAKYIADEFDDKDRYIPDNTLTFREFRAIKDFYSPSDFERTSYLTFSLPVSIAVTVAGSRFFRKFRR